MRSRLGIGLATVLLPLALGASCRGEPAQSSVSNTLPVANGRDPASASRDAWFIDATRDTGLDFVHFNGMSGEYHLPEIIAPGVAFLDYDNDGDLDVYLVQGRALEPGKPPVSNRTPDGGGASLKGRLFRNDLTRSTGGSPQLHFTDVTDRSGIEATGYGIGVAAGDIDNDGWVDLYLTNFGRNQLYRNNGDGTFTDISKRSGTDDDGFSVSASFLDYDRDGWLDLYVAHYVNYRVGKETKCRVLAGGFDYCPPQAFRAQPSRLYHNNRDGTFSDVTAAAGMAGKVGPALGVSTADFDNDGWIDIYVAIDGEDNQLWINQRDGTFRNTALVAGAALSELGKPEASMGVDAGDFDNDGDEDLFMTHLEGQGNNLYVNLGSGTFDDRSASSGLGPPSLPFTGFGTAWFDFDNDGWLDLATVNGTILAIEGRKTRFPYDQVRQLFRNLGNGKFEDVTSRAGAAFQLSEVGRGAAFGDVDNDGDVDVLVGNLNGPARLLLNGVGNRHHWLGLKLVGEPVKGSALGIPAEPLPGQLSVFLARSARLVRYAVQQRGQNPRGEPHNGLTPRDMLGARVTVIRRDGSMLWRRARADGSYASANDPRVLVGLGNSADPPRLRVRWPDGRTEEWSEVAVDRWTTLREGSGR